jgi:uncharacterized membrane protein YphA (DoxX/SURF4 family)
LTRTDRALRIVLGAVFLAAGILKIVDPAAFAISIARLRILPMALVGPAAILLPWIEVVSAAALVLPKFRRAALQLLLGLLIVFSAVLGIGLLRGATSCGCFGSSDGFLSRADVALVRNLILLALVGFLLLRKPTSPASPASPA